MYATLTAALLSALTFAAPAVSSSTHRPGKHLSPFVPATDIQYLGRVNPATNQLTWPSTGLAFSFVGKSASINFASVTGDNSVDLFIDDDEPIVIANVSSYSITTPSGLNGGWHTVELRKRSEASYGTLTLESITSKGRLGRAHIPRRRIEIIGDSISVGYGLDGEFPCVNTAAIEDNPRTYGALAAEALHADYSVIAWSGRGIVRNYVTVGVDTSPILPEVYTRYGALDPDNSYTFPRSDTPDAVVINLGQNDFGYLLTNSSGQSYAARPPLDITVYTNAMVEFVRSIRRHYPRAHFFLLSSPMLSDGYPSAAEAQHTTQVNALKDAVNQLGEKRTHFVNWAPQGSDVGCDYHPNAATHAAEAEVLAAAIKSALRW